MTTFTLCRAGELAGLLEECRVRTWKEFQDALEQASASKPKAIYRGHSSSEWFLSPTLERLTVALDKRREKRTDSDENARRRIEVNGTILTFSRMAGLMACIGPARPPPATRVRVLYVAASSAARSWPESAAMEAMIRSV